MTRTNDKGHQPSGGETTRTRSRPGQILEEEEEEETLFDPKCTIHHISDAKLDINQYTHMFTYICTYMHIHLYIYIINTKTI